MHSIKPSDFILFKEGLNINSGIKYLSLLILIFCCLKEIILFNSGELLGFFISSSKSKETSQLFILISSNNLEISGSIKSICWFNKLLVKKELRWFPSISKGKIACFKAVPSKTGTIKEFDPPKSKTEPEVIPDEIKKLLDVK